MQLNLLKHLVEKIAGTAAIPIVDILNSKKDVNEFLIAKKMDKTINQVRNILYKLSAEGLVSFIRKKDKRRGWYIYFWTLDSSRGLAMIKADIIREIQEIKRKLEDREKNRYYICKSCNIELTEELALERDFSCEECAGLYELSESSLIKKELLNNLARKEKTLESVDSEIAIIKEEENKNRIAKQKKSEREKQAEKEKKRLEKKRGKERIDKENLKKHSQKEKTKERRERKK